MALYAQKPDSAAGLDTEVLAVRQLMEEQGVQDAQEHLILPARSQGPEQFSQSTELPDTGQQPSTGGLGTLLRFAVQGAKSYRPDRKRILWTSLVLMLLLQPFFVFGWSFAVAAIVVAIYWAMGADRFWRRVIDAYGVAEMRWPVAARQAKLRGYAFGKKWNRLLSHLPDRLTDHLRAPDLRLIIAADVAHDEAMSDRLTRL